jgi:hypothetical protein
MHFFDKCNTLPAKREVSIVKRRPVWLEKLAGLE